MCAAQRILRTQDQVNFDLLFVVEDKHFWFRTRNQIIEALTKQIVRNLPVECRVLEIGCGTGNVMRVLARACPNGTIVGVDLFPEGMRYARLRGANNLILADARAPPFGIKFHMICLFDVLEHLPDDTRMLRELHSMLEPEGALMLTVPAHQWLWSYVDQVSSHQRRYERPVLEKTLQQAGFKLEFMTEFMAILLPLIYLRRLWGRVLARSKFTDIGCRRQLAYDELRVSPFLNRPLELLLSLETRLIAKRKKFPFGTSLLAVARKAQLHI